MNRSNCATAVLTTLMTVAAYGQTEVVLHNFGNSPPRGGEPNAVIRDSAGNLYGTTAFGGLYGVGVLFEVTAAGQQTVLYNFGNGPEGFSPTGSLLLDAAGNLYGATSWAPATYAGAIFMLTPAGNMTVLYTFTGGSDGFQPTGSLIRDDAGNLYGTTYSGGTYGAGVVYRLDASGHLTVLYAFTGGSDGANPNPGLVRDSAGNLYGTTFTGGQGDCYNPNTPACGVVFKILKGGGAEIVLYRFTLADGGNPKSGVVLDSSGNIYGTTTTGGSNAYYGVIYKLDATNQYTVLHNLSLRDGEGWAGVIRDPAGNIYGNTRDEIFELQPGGNYKRLYKFEATLNGTDPYAGIIRDPDGNLYGTTYSGGVANQGVVYKLPVGGQYTVLYRFPDPNPTNGADPVGGLAADPEGNLYGTTFAGGISNIGTVYKQDASGHQTVLYNFMNGTDGANPWAGVTLDGAGNLYGTTLYAGAAYAGNVFKLDAAGNETVLYTFTGGSDGGIPFARVILDAAGNLYGTTSYGGAANVGVAYRLDSGGNETVLYSFTGGPDGGHPSSALTLDKAGNLFGTTEYGGAANAGVVYKLDSNGHETVLYSFTGSADGAYPVSVIREPDGNFYGTAYGGGASNAGVVFHLDPAGNETVLYSFTGGADGGLPFGGVIRDAAGNLYGTTTDGGTANVGVVFMLDPAGHETVLYTFTGGADGAYPESGVIRGSTGNLYGTTEYGGKRAGGVVFEIRPASAQ